MAELGFSGSAGWMTFAGLCAIIWNVFKARRRSSDIYEVGSVSIATTKVSRSEMPLFSLAYGLAGFGYIVTATYLPVIANTTIPQSPLLNLFWPLLGVAAVIGSLGAAKMKKTADARLYLVAAYLLQAAGVGVSVV